MKIMEFLEEKAVSPDLEATKKPEVVKELLSLLVKAGRVKEKDKAALLKILLEREALGSTGIGQGVGIPHGKSNSVKELVGAVGISKKGVNFESLDGEPVHIFFLLLAPEESAGPHLKALAGISRLLKDKYFRDALRNAKDDRAIVKFIKEEDERKH